MKKKLLPILISVPLITMISAGAIALEVKQNNQVQKNNQQVTSDPFDNDAFFQSPNDILKQMDQTQRAMDQFMKSQFLQMQHNLVNQPNQMPFGSTNTIEIKESKNEIIYKIKLPKGADGKVDVSVKEGQLRVSSNVTQKITREQDNSKSVSYSQSNYSQAFQLPEGYDPNTMTTKMKDSNLIVIFKKSIATSSVL
ncbi:MULTISPECIES: Hsp20/alpha crystallin family protein [Legionella]|uniref:Hsp20/alpha crystallin family protein n=1 Tax=Legionella resiliens TaxID=2905958 RepID=A0ABS8X4L1_9GAMM|nr:MULTISPECIES: Hsp20/alpha crystallin family protein [unclassified Legionella]MCE0723623.1 Hsp20/alpha crystallin family protein [Legionella sp. 9fVS26]MCE3532776.1 Hsp20/alpha crystallin family protein [Legionella sp. 8cVS16]QLZ68912.1 Hsp20/alpha crystallin family protein [Legionella sp. PC1000]